MTVYFRVLKVLALSVLLVGCAATPKRSDYEAFRAENPRSILVVPPINKSVEVTAPDYFLTTISAPLVERGYYVFPINTARTVLADDGLSDADMVHAGDPRKLGELFGADTVLYISIERWDARYAVLSTTVTVELQYVLKSAHSGRELWKTARVVTYTPNSSNVPGVAGLIANAIKAAIEKAAPDYMPLAKLANDQAINLKETGLPAGPYSPMYQKDGKSF
jgi:hypothetical protein